MRHSLSPLILNTAFRARDLDWVFLAFPVPDGEAESALEAMRTLGIDGLSVTMPHKTAVADAVDMLSPDAEALRAVNCVAREGDVLVGHNTDGRGFLAGLHADTGFDPSGSRCVVLGAGGAARAVVLALAGSGAREVVVVNRTKARAKKAAALGGPVGRVGDVAEVRSADLVVNATSVGMATDGGPEPTALPLDPELLGPAHVVVDLIYRPLTTPLLAEARTRGATAVNGVSMLVHQAARSFELWTGAPAPVDEMSAAVAAAVADR